MTWDLDTCINLSGTPSECLESLINFFEPDLENIQFKAAQGRWPEEKVLAEHDNIVWQLNSFIRLKELFNQYLQVSDIRITVGLGLYGYGDFSYSPYPEFVFKGFQKKSYNFVRQESDIELLFGNHKAYKGENKLPKSGRCLDTNLVTQALEYICREAQPKDLYLLSEQGVCIPWTYHFIFHNTPEGYLQDLKDVLQLVIYGGDEQYPDDRSTYESGLSDDSGRQYLMYGGRNHEHISFLKDFIRKYGVPLEQQGLPATLTREDLEDSVLDACSLGDDDYPLMDFFFVGDGLGVYGKPLLQRYCEYIFMALMARFVEQGDEAISFS
jgi:hypothetical protein